MLIFFFFQAEDGIRDYKVTGVQTCALPISEPIGDDSYGQYNLCGLYKPSGWHSIDSTFQDCRESVESMLETQYSSQSRTHTGNTEFDCRPSFSEETGQTRLETSSRAFHDTGQNL